MRRRLTATMVLLTVGTLLVTGVVTLLLTVRTARQQTRRELAHEAILLANAVQTQTAGDSTGLRAVRLRRVLATLEKPLRLEGSALVTIGANGLPASTPGTGAAQALPDGLVPADLDPAALGAGRTVSATKGNLVFAAAPFALDYRVGNRPLVAREVVILVRAAPTGLRTALPWLLVSSGGVLIVAVVGADRLARRTVRPLRAVETVAGRIAAGDLSARVTEEAGSDLELRHLGSSINAMAQALAEAKGAQRQFLLSVSHELRTPLTSIRGFAEALEDGTAGDVTRAAGIIASESRRLDRLVSDLLDLARLDTGRFSLRPRPVDLLTVVDDAVAAFGPAAAELGLALHPAVEPGDPDPPLGTALGPGDLGPSLGTAVGPGDLGPTSRGAGLTVMADPDRLAQVVSNLVENALNYASAAVTVGASAAAGAAVLWVDDDGPGVAAEDRPHIFTPLFSSARRPGRRFGTGLGLAIVADLVAAMGGSVRAEPAPGGGTRVVVTLEVVSVPGTLAAGR